MTCIKRGTLQELVDGELTEKAKQPVARHLKGCQKCREVLERIKADRDFLREKMRSLDPAKVPQLDFMSNQESRQREPHISFVLAFLQKPIRIPAGAVILAGLVFAGLVLGLFAQNRHLAKTKVSPSKKGPRTILYVSSGGSIQSFPLDLDLDDYKPIQNPNVILLKEK
jgi:anti-sigma factor RsiW